MDVYRLTNRTPARISSSFSSSVFHTGSTPSSRLRSRSPAWALSWSSVLEIGTAWTHASVDRRTATMEVEAESFITEGRVGSLQGIQERRTFVDRGNCSYIRSPEANCRGRDVSSVHAEGSTGNNSIRELRCVHAESCVRICKTVEPTTELDK